MNVTQHKELGISCRWLKGTIQRAVCLVVFTWPAINSTALWAQRTELQFVDGSVAAKPEYVGDHYIDAQGHTVRVYRKQGVFVAPAGSKSTSHSHNHVNKNVGNSVGKTVMRHNLPGAHVVKVKQTGQHKKSLGQAITTISKTQAQIITGVPDLQPVFTSKTGLGDLLLLPAITVSLDATADAPALLDELKSGFKLSLLRQLKVSGQVYSLSTNGGTRSPTEHFSLLRRVGQLPGVEWAEPQFFMQAQKAMFTPNDTLYSQQWNMHNSGFRGSRCDADCDALDAWQLDNGTGAATGAGTIIAIIDDGVQLNHPEFDIATGGNDYVDDTSTLCGDDGIAGFMSDSDANPSSVVDCVIAGDKIEPDNHGTAVTGIAAAKAGNGGVVGTAFNAQILPIRAISNYEVASLSTSAQCNRLAEAVEYAAQRADVINLSWNLPLGCSALSQAIERTSRGDVIVGLGSKRSGGSPVVVASGNNASGWVKVSAEVDAGKHAYEWRFLRSDTPNSNTAGFDETVWLDDITWANGDIEDFESISRFSTGSAFTTDWELNQCNNECTFNFGDEPVWGINTNSVVNYARSGVNAASINVGNSDCGNSYLHTLREDPAGTLSFWVWVSADTQDGFDKFEFLIDGNEVISYGDLGVFGFVDNPVGYPANLSNNNSSTEAGVIAVGASTSGDLGGVTTQNQNAQYRAPYSQFGPTLDVVAPSGDQHLAITTTDRFSLTGVDTLGYNTASSVGELSNRQYTQSFTGTSAAAPLVSGIAASIIASVPSVTAQQVKDFIKNSADKIGNEAYTGGRNDFYGHGRVNMYKALRMARGQTVSEPTVDCVAESFDYTVANDLILPRYAPQTISGQCPALGPIIEGPQEEICFPIIASNSNVATVCL